MTKNNLSVDKEQLKTMIRGLTKWYVKRDNTEVGEPNTAVGLLYDDVMFGIDRLPSVTPQEPRWIPVSERMPEPSRLVLCYITTGVTETYFLALWNDILNAWEEGIGGYRLLENDLGYEVIAWMPLPKPYETQESEDKK